MSQEEKNKIYSGLATAVFFELVVVVCLAFGYDPPDPPIPEEGVEVNLGNSDFGSGDNPMPDAEEAAGRPSASSASEQLITQHHEATTALNSSATRVTNNNPIPTVKETPAEPEINKRALFSKRGGNSSKGGSEGKTYGEGNQGKAGGDPNSSRYDGAPGKGGAGFSLTGRSARALPSPQTSSNKQGKIVVKIWVDANGNVTQTAAPEKGSTLTDAGLVQLARSTAMKAKFSPSDAEVQTGTITYIFTNN